MEKVCRFPNLQTYVIISDGLCKHQQLDKALVLFHQLEGQGIIPNIIIYSILINGMCNAEKLENVRKFF